MLGRGAGGVAFLLVRQNSDREVWRKRGSRASGESRRPSSARRVETQRDGRTLCCHDVSLNLVSLNLFKPGTKVSNAVAIVSDRAQSDLCCRSCRDAAPAGGLLVDNDIKGNSRIGVGSGGNTTDAAIYKISDTNTGIIWPAADTLAFTTAGAERIRIDSSGNVGIGTSAPGYTLEVNGSFAATTKSFVIDHPTKEGMKLRYGSLEGPENGVYVRGRLKDSNVIELPDYWTGLVHEDSITVSLTAIGKSQELYVIDINDNKVTVGGGDDENINCFYTIFAERKDVEKLKVEYK